MRVQRQAQLVILEEEKEAVEAKVQQEHQELEAANAQNRSLSDQIEAVTKCLEEKCRVAVSQADQKMSQLQVSICSVSEHIMMCICRHQFAESASDIVHSLLIQCAATPLCVFLQ